MDRINLEGTERLTPMQLCIFGCKALGQAQVKIVFSQFLKSIEGKLHLRHGLICGTLENLFVRVVFNMPLFYMVNSYWYQNWHR